MIPDTSPAPSHASSNRESGGEEPLMHKGRIGLCYKGILLVDMVYVLGMIYGNRD